MLKRLETGKTKNGSAARKATTLDTRMGNLLRQKRTLVGLSQEDVGDRIGLTHQAYQRYEGGKHRLAIYMLIKIADAIGFDPVQFLAEITQKDSQIPTKDTFGTEESRLVTAFIEIKSARDKNFVLKMARHFAGRTEEGEL